MTDLLPALSGAYGDRADAVVVNDERRSWSELVSEAGALAARLAGLSAVAVDATPTLDTIRAVVAALMAGVPIVPVPPDSGVSERHHILRDSGAEAVIGHTSWASLPEILPGDHAVHEWQPPDEHDPGDAALVMYTSGTTGSPKGVVLSRRALAAGIDGLAEAWQWTPDDVLVHGLPLFHVHGLVLGVLGALRVGSRVVHTGKPTPQAYATAAGQGGSLFFGVPTVWSRLCADGEAAKSLTSARLLVSGSAPLPVSVFDQLLALTGHMPVERYGMTETLITLSTRADGERRPGWVGEPVRGVIARIVDDDGGPVTPGVLGELQVRGATLFEGYLHRPEATAAAFDDEWFRTGDAAVADEVGFHRIVGRQSMDIIKTGGFKVGAGEVEASLLGHPAVREVAVVGVPDDDLGQRIVAFVVGDRVAPAVLIDHVAAELSAHKRPREVRFVEALPRNAMGKVQKHQLSDRA
jgi:fatty acid CoA ligase FadD36